MSFFGSVLEDTDHTFFPCVQSQIKSQSEYWLKLILFEQSRVLDSRLIEKDRFPEHPQKHMKLRFHPNTGYSWKEKIQGVINPIFNRNATIPYKSTRSTSNSFFGIMNFSLTGLATIVSPGLSGWLSPGLTSNDCKGGQIEADCHTDSRPRSILKPPSRPTDTPPLSEGLAKLVLSIEQIKAVVAATTHARRDAKTLQFFPAGLQAAIHKVRIIIIRGTAPSPGHPTDAAPVRGALRRRSNDITRLLAQMELLETLIKVLSCEIATAEKHTTPPAAEITTPSTIRY